MAMEIVRFSSRILGREFEYRILLPEEDHRPLPTLYLLHGYGGSSANWLEKSDVVRWAEEYHLAIVLPSCGDGYYQDNPRTGEQMKRFLGEELVAETRARFPLSHRREDTYIAGASMGGFGSLLVGSRYSPLFSRIACVAGAFVPYILGVGMSAQYFLDTFGDYESLEGSDREPFGEAKRALSEGRMIPVYLACGRQDIHMACNLRMRDMLQAAGASVAWSEAEGGHEWSYFNRCFPQVIRWLLKARSA